MENRQLLMIEDEEEICQQVADYFAADDGITLMDTVQDGCVSQEQLIKAVCIYCSAGARRFMGSCGEAAQISRNSALHQRNSSIWQSLHRFVLR